MLINRTYAEARLAAISLLSNHYIFPTNITIKPRECNGKIEWRVIYDEQYYEEMENEK